MKNGNLGSKQTDNGSRQTTLWEFIDGKDLGDGGNHVGKGIRPTARIDLGREGGPT